MNFDIHHADVREWARRYDGAPHHAMLCDPPYELGFMGKQWDNSGVAFQPETWAALGEHLHPGAFLMAFAGTRGYHRMACAIEDAGFILHPVMVWNFATGFPKATRVKDDERFEGHRYGLQALKPAVEMICVAQKPYKGRPAACITATGAGALNVDAGRIEGESWGANGVQTGGESIGRYGDGLNNSGRTGSHDAGRWPSNFCLDEEAARRLDAQSGIRKSGAKTADHVRTTSKTKNAYGERAAPIEIYAASEGGASRFHHCSDWNAETAERIALADPVKYSAKTRSSEREAGCDRLPVMDWMAGHTAPIPQRDERNSPGSGNHHPTLKPLSLTRWLSSLLLPPAEYADRRILVPFSGTMSEGMGAALSGWEHVTGIEQSAEYIQIAQARIRHHLGMLAEVQVLAGAEVTP